MIGTLVDSLPSSHAGGELVIEHNNKTVVYQASADEVTVTAFYADCRHEIKPVRTGYQVAFTCNLLLDPDPAGEVPAEPSAEAARYLTEHFTTRVSRWKGDDREPPNRLVYLLDHEYTQRGLAGTGSRAPTPNGPRSCGLPLRMRVARRYSRSPRSRRPGTPSRGGGAAASISRTSSPPS